MMRGPALENRNLFERPRLRDNLPPWLPPEEGFGITKIGFVIGTKIEARALPCPLRHHLQKLRLQEPVLVMAAFGPRIGKKNEKRGNRGFWG